jgi:drug/metabolite transporter (DMT)-like permease
MIMLSIRAAVAFLIVGAVCISLSGVWVKWADVPASTSAFHRVFLGGLMLLALAARRGELRHITKGQLGMALVVGLFFAVDLYFFHMSILRVGPGLGTILPNFQVFILAAVGILFMGERLRLAYVLSVPCAFFGLFLIVGLDWSAMDPEYVAGIWYGLGAAVMYSLFLLSLRRMQSRASGSTMFAVMGLVSLATAPFLGLEALYNGYSLVPPTFQAAAYLFVLALLSQVAGWSLIVTSLPHVRASVAGIILLLQPALAFVWDCLLFQRPSTALNWLGLGLVLGAIYAGSVRRPKRSGTTVTVKVT